jgi:hypothetical protein
MRRPSSRYLAAAGALALVALVGLRVGCQRSAPRKRSGGPGLVSEPIPPPPPAIIPPAHDVKLAFIGDTGAGTDFRLVLELIRRERTDAVVQMGDAVYAEDPAQFWGAVDRVLGHDFPYFLAQGNHDVSQWAALGAHADQHLGRADQLSTRAPGDPRFGLVFKGVSLIALGHQVQDDDPRAIVERFSHDEHIWKICAWHKNQQAMQVGGKGDEMGWGVYEACRLMGAFIVTGHEHSYERTKTLSSTVTQEVDPACSDPHHLCVRPGAVPVFVSGLGGRSIRVQSRCLPYSYPYGCRGEWGFIYTSNQAATFGALFITFDQADPHKARGYFETIDGRIVDTFDLVAQ